MYKEYRELYNKYNAIYGDKTAIFLQVGSFYELYDSQDPLTSNTACNCREIVDYLGIQLTYRRCDGEAGWDGLFAGIPDHSLHKWAGRLTDAGWTVVVVDQVKDDTGRVMRREVARILSPGTHVETACGADSPIIAAIWLDIPAFGVAMLDLTTGVTETASGHVNGDIESWTSDTLIQFIQIKNPRELLVLWRGDGLLTPDEGSLRRKIGYSGNGLMHIRSALPEYQGAFESPMSREEYLRGIYGIKSLLPTREWLHIGDGAEQERALIGLLRFVEDHFPSALTVLQKNTRWSPKSALVLGNHALTQLQMTSQRIQDSVLGIFKSTITPMGKRAIRERILTPSADAALIRQRIAEVDSYLSMNEDTQKNLLGGLKGIYDLPRLHRRLICGTVSAADILALDQSYTVARYIGQLGLPEALMPALGTVFLERLARWKRDMFDAYFSTAKAATITDDITFIVTSGEKYGALAAIEVRLAEIRESVQKFVDMCGSIAGRSRDGGGFKIEERDRQPYSIRGTKASLQVLQTALKGATAPQSVIDAMKGAEIHVQKGGGWVEVPWLDVTNREVIRLRDELRVEVARIMPTVCAAVVADAPWQELEDWLTIVDITQCIGRESVAHKFCRPSILDCETGQGASIEAKGLRHPLIEMTLSRTQYVAHDVAMGSGVNSWLIYGMNASGKSSLMKSIGIAVHLAQAGCYVPATELTIRPFRAIYTRILNQDNLWAGLSSFAVEMSEMRDILNGADERSLVLGDELCSGTESVSAQALVAAGIEWLSKKQARFVFATHLHGLLDVLPDPKSLSMQVWHLKVKYDAARDKLIYERTLTPGAGSTLYGIEVARAMHLPVEFIESALKLRRRIGGTVAPEESTGSSWNSAIFRRKCEMCDHDIVSELEVHHIHHRADNGSNDVRNLIVVCSKCHDDTHAGKTHIGQIVQTSSGPERVTASSTASTASTTSKWNNEEMAIIVNMLRTYKILPLKQIVFRLKVEHDIEISEQTLRKIRRDGA